MSPARTHELERRHEIAALSFSYSGENLKRLQVIERGQFALAAFELWRRHLASGFPRNEPFRGE
jgi:hypothetical protein